MGLMYIAAELKKAGHEIKIHDCALDYGDLHILRQTIKDWKPDLIGISIIITELEQTRKIMRMIREMTTNIPVTFGGPWPSANPEEALKNFGADFVVIGEGELVFTELIDAVNKKLPTDSIPGTASLVNGSLKINQGRYLSEDELNALSYPAWELLDHNLYKKNNSFATVGCRPYMTIITSRGCPYRCVYCHQTMGKVFRKRSAESVIAEMQELRFKYGFKEFEIADDCFNLDRERMYSILTGIRDRIGDVKLHFPNAVRSDMLEPEDLALFKQAGTVSASFAIETAIPRLQRMIQKNLDIEKAARAINAAVKEGIYSFGYFMIGFPTETLEEASATVEFSLRAPLHSAAFMMVTPFAGTELEKMIPDEMKKRNVFSDQRNTTYFTNTLNISAMSDSDLQTIVRLAYKRFYLNPKRILSIALHHPRIHSLPKYALITLLKILRFRLSAK